MEHNYNVHFCMLLTLITGYLRDAVSLGCNSRLLADRVLVPDTSFQHSSAATIQHGAAAAREDPNDLGLQERAWCPDAKVGTELREFMEIDLGRQSIIKLIITKGRVAQSKGRQTTPYFYIKYRRELTGTWFDYEKENGTKRLAGNQDAMTENFNTMDPPFVARYVRIYPFSLEPTKTCLKLELLGCEANGIVEYKAPEGALLPEIISSSHQMYGNSHSSERTRLLDTSYDSKSHKFRIFDNMQKDFGDEKAYQTIIEGGLGKLTDNDTEFKASTSPFSSHKFVGWRRKMTSKTISTTTLSTESIVDSITSNYNAEMEYDFIRIIFRFDMIYNFSSIRLYVSNDFLVGLTIPRNITVGFSFQDPSLSYYYRGHRTKHRRDQQKEPPRNLWSSSILYQVTPDKQNTDSRWITLPIHEVVELYHGIQSVSKHQSNTLGHLYNSNNNSESKKPDIFGLGEFVELRIFFNSQWLAVGEILFENTQMSNLKFKPEEMTAYEIVQQESRSATTGLPYLLNQGTSTLGYPLGQTTTYVLAIICSLLVILICCGLFCLFCVWGRERLRAPFRRKFNRSNKRFCDSTQFDSNSCVNKSSTQNASLLADQVKINNLMNNTTVSTSNSVSGDIQYQFQHPKRCQDVNTGLPSTTAYLGGFQLLTTNGISPISINLTTNSIHPTFQQAGVENKNYSAHTNLQNNLFISSSNEANTNLSPTSISGPNMYGLNGSIPVLPIMTPNFISSGSITSNLHGTYLRPKEGVFNNTGYQKAFHDNSIYTSLPGSDCDSQPYAKVDTLNGSVMRQFNLNSSNLDPSKINISFNQCNGESRLFHPINLPPPPSLPLPPTPEHLTTAIQTISLRNKNEANHVSNSVRKNVNSAFYQHNSDGNKSIPNNDTSTWLDTNSQVISTSNPLFDTSECVDQMNLNAINNSHIFSAVQNSDYSNSTTNDSNTYSAYYGPPNVLPISVPTVQMITIKR